MNGLRNKPISVKKTYLTTEIDGYSCLQSDFQWSLWHVTRFSDTTIVVDRITVEQFWCRVAAQIWISSHLTVWRQVHTYLLFYDLVMHRCRHWRQQKIDDMRDTQSRFSLAYKYNHNWHIHNKSSFLPTRPVDHWPEKPSNINQETTFDQHTHPQNILDQSCKKHDPKVKESLDPSFLQARKKRSANNNHK